MVRGPWSASRSSEASPRPAAANNGPRTTDSPRIFDRYGREVVSLAILTDDDPDWRPNRYESSRWGFRTLTEFPIVKLIDYAAQYEQLEADPNPFAVAVLAHLKAMETRRSPEGRRAWKVRLVKGLYERGMGPEDVRRLFRFIDWVLELPAALQGGFRDEVEAYQEETRMPLIDMYEQIGIEKVCDRASRLRWT